MARHTLSSSLDLIDVTELPHRRGRCQHSAGWDRWQPKNRWRRTRHEGTVRLCVDSEACAGIGV